MHAQAGHTGAGQIPLAIFASLDYFDTGPVTFLLKKIIFPYFLVDVFARLDHPTRRDL